MPDPHEARRQHVQQEPADELDRRRASSSPAGRRGRSPSSGSVTSAVREGDQAAVADRHPVGVPGQVLQHLSRARRTAAWRRRPTRSGPSRRAGGGTRSGRPAPPSLPGKRSRPRSKAARSPARNLPRNTRLRTRTGRKKSARPATQRLPSGDEPAAGDDAMDVRVEREVLAPGVQHRQHADLGPEVLRVRRPPRAGSRRRPASAGRRPRGGCASAIGPRAPGSVKTTWKYGVSSRSAAWASSHRAAAVAWHLGQWRLPHEL